MEGYVLKKISNSFGLWRRCWLTLKDNQLVYQKHCGELNVLYTMGLECDFKILNGVVVNE
jgi:hypothetical protein